MFEEEMFEVTRVSLFYKMITLEMEISKTKCTRVSDIEFLFLFFSFAKTDRERQVNLAS